MLEAMRMEEKRRGGESRLLRGDETRAFGCQLPEMEKLPW